MIAEVARRVPDALGAYRGGVAEGPGGPAATPLCALRDPAVFEAVLAAFGAGIGEAGASLDRRALVSYWSQFYLALLATPALTALLRLGRPLPLAFERTSLELDAAGRPARLLVEADRAAAQKPGLAGLIEEHLAPFVALCHARGGPAPRVLWGNAAVILDYVARALDDAQAPARAEVAACLGWCGDAACATRSPLAQALCPGASDCRRRTCCLRQRLPGVPSCGPLCPLERASGRCRGSRC